MAYRINVDRGNKNNVSIDAIFETCGGIQKLAIVESDYLDETLGRIAELEAQVAEYELAKEYIR